MFEDYEALAPLQAAASLLADREWPHRSDRDTLPSNSIPVAAAINVEGMYVEHSLAEETASQIRGVRTWITTEYEHNGLRIDGERILSHLIDLARGRT